MFDFKISDTGDLVLDETENIAKAKIKFGLSEYPVLNINFIQNKTSKKIDENPLRMKAMFSVNQKGKTENCQTVLDEDELIQRIMILLRTEYGSIPRDKKFGSYINTERHEDITDDGVLERIKSLVEEELTDILDNPTVVVKRVITDEIFGSQNINIYIYNNKLNPICDFKLEEL